MGFSFMNAEHMPSFSAYTHCARSAFSCAESFNNTVSFVMDALIAASIIICAIISVNYVVNVVRLNIVAVVLNAVAVIALILIVRIRPQTPESYTRI